MPLDASGLGAVIKTELTAAVMPTNPEELEKFCNAIGKAIVEYLVANAIVQGTVLSGAGAGGSVTGTLT